MLMDAAVCKVGANVENKDLGVHLLQPSADEELEDGDDVARVGSHSAPEPLNLMGEGASML